MTRAKQPGWKNLTIGGTFYPGEIFGATIAAPIWKQIMDRTSAGMPLLDFANLQQQCPSPATSC